MSSSVLSTQVSTPSGSSSSTELDTNYGSTTPTVAKQQVQDIKPTSVGSITPGYKTKSLQQESVQPSFKVTDSPSSQFAMQHATKTLPSNSVTMATTSYTSQTPTVDQNAKSSSIQTNSGTAVPSKSSDLSDISVVTIATKASSVPKSVHSSSSTTEAIQATKEGKDAELVTKADAGTSKYEPVVSDTMSPTVSQSAGQTASIGLTSASVTNIAPHGSSSKSQETTSATYSAVSRDLYHTVTPSKTDFPSSVSTVSLKTTPLASLTMTPSVKPITTESGTSTPLFGGKNVDGICNCKNIL